MKELFFTGSAQDIPEISREAQEMESGDILAVV
jgi:hypothetical protein